MTLDLRRLDEMPRAELIALAQQFGIERPERMTRVELKDELVRVSITDAALRERSRGWLGVARDLVASVVEAGLHMPDAAKVIRGEVQRIDASPRRPPVATVTLAEIYAAQGHTRRALKMLEQVLEKEPDHEVARVLKEQLLAQAAVPDAAKATSGERAALGLRLNLSDAGGRFRDAGVDPVPEGVFDDDEGPLSMPEPLSIPVPPPMPEPLSVPEPPLAEQPPMPEALSISVPPSVPEPRFLTQPAPAPGAARGVEEGPTLEEKPRFEEKPTLEEAPTFEVAPRAEEGSTLEEAPTFELPPRAEDGLTFEEAPTLQVAPTFQVAPTLEEAPRVEVAPTLEEAPRVEVAPTLEEAPRAEVAVPADERPTLEMAPTPEVAPAAPAVDTFVLPPLAAQAWVVILRGDTGPVAVWHVDPGVLEYYQARQPDAEPALKIVGMQSSWEEVERHELDVPVAAATGLQRLPSLASVPCIRAALGVQVGKTFRPLVIGIEASVDGVTFRPRGVTAQFAQTALERARSLARPD